MAFPFLSVVLPTFQLRSRIAVTLAALEAQTLDPSEFELIFIDDGSNDGTADAIEAWPSAHRRRVLRNRQNVGRSITRNRGWREARGDVIVFLDGDMIVHPRLLETYHQRFAAGSVDVVSGARSCLDLSAEQEVDGATIARIANRDSPRQLFRGGSADFEALKDRSVLGPLPGQTQLEAQLEEICVDHPRSLTRALAFITSNVGVRREALLATRGFAPLLPSGEDTDLGLQLAERGARFAYEPRAEAIHPFVRLTTNPEQLASAFQTLLMRHPFTVVVLWWCWARAPGAAPFPRLSDIARAEADGSLADLDIEAIAEQSQIRLPLHFPSPRDALAAFWCWALRLPAEATSSLLDRAVAQGLLHRRRADKAFFDFALTQNWLAEHSTCRQHAYEHSFFAHHLTPRQRGARDAPAVAIRWQGRYEAEIPTSLLGRSQALIANIPVPVGTRCQTAVEIDAYEPPALADYVQDGTIVGYPLEAGEAPTLRLGYKFTCRVQEFDEALPDEAMTSDMALWLRPLTLAGKPALRRLLRGILPTAQPSPETSARLIYEWMLDHTEFRANPNAFDAVATARTGMGHCIQLARLYVALCRLARVPARERCGVLIDWHRPGDRPLSAEIRLVGQPFAHTWAEFHCPGKGWTPVDMISVAHGQRVVTPWNFPDEELRRRMCAEQAGHDAYYFGGLDPFRIHGPAWRQDLPLVARRGRDGWEPVSNPDLDLRQTIRVEGVREP